MYTKRILPKMIITLLSLTGFLTCLASDELTENSSAGIQGSFKMRKIFAGLEYTFQYDRPLKGDPIDMAYQFFELNKEKLGVKNPREELVYQGTVSGDGRVTRISFGQSYNGFGIRNGGIRVFFTTEGEIKRIDGRYFYDINLSTNYSIDSVTAVGIALKDIGTMPETEVPLIRCPGKPIIVPSSELNLRNESRLYLVWPISIFTVTAESYYADSVDYGGGIKLRPLAPTGKEYVRYIEAHNGNIVKSGDSSPKDRRYRGPQ